MNTSGPDPSILGYIVRTKMPFGKYKNNALCDLPMFYLEWMKRTGFPAGKLGMALETVHEIKSNGLEHILAPIRRMEVQKKT
jgi:uncharacterized protein (DUF3820 family)